MENYLGKEVFLPVAGYEGLYEVSNLGRVRSLDRIITTSSGVKRRYRGKTLTPATANKWGHRVVNLCGKGGRVTQKVHQVHTLVLTAFVGPRPEGMECCHQDGDPSNNILSNLRWDTPSSNNYDTVKHGNHFWANKVVCPRGHKLSGDNLEPSARRKGKRQCRTCANTRSYLWRHPDADQETVSNHYYMRYVAEGEINE